MAPDRQDEIQRDAGGKLILASASPRRQELLALTGIPFEVRVSDVREITREREPGRIVEELSFLKASAVAAQLAEDERDRIVLGADTIVWKDGKALGKPGNREEARRMITALQDHWHSVFTGVTLIGREKSLSFHVETRVHVHAMEEEEIERYIASGEPYDKAGGYGIQGPFAVFVDRIEGDYCNVVGLPVGEVYRALSAFGKD